jgi:hypothetical protein
MTVAELIEKLSALPEHMRSMTVIVPGEAEWVEPTKLTPIKVRPARPGTGELCYCDWVADEGAETVLLGLFL